MWREDRDREAESSSEHSWRMLLLALLAILVAATRIHSAAATMWESDEALFALGVRAYDVAAHRPHPPGYPLFIAVAKLVRPLVASEFHALQLINIAAATLLFPVIYVLGRAIGYSVATSICGSLIAAFTPNIWYYGGTAFSDVPAMVCGVLAAGLYWRRDQRSGTFISATIVAAVSLAIRPQTLLLLLAPGCAAAWQMFKHSRAVVLLALVIGIAIAGGSFAAAAHVTGPERFLGAIHQQSEYVARVDSIQNPTRKPISRLWGDFLLHRERFGTRQITDVVLFFSVVSIVAGAWRKQPRTIRMLATFLPPAVFGMLTLDLGALHRYAVLWTPMICILTADGIAVAAGLMTGRAERAVWVQSALCGVLIAVLLGWGWNVVHWPARNDSPPAAAMEWIRQNVPVNSRLFIAAGLAPFAACYLPDRAYSVVGGVTEIPSWSDTREAVFVSADLPPSSGAVRFEWPRKPLVRFSRDRYFRVEVVRLRHLPRTITLGFGWHDRESNGDVSWNWMGRRSEIILSPLSGSGELRVKAQLAHEVVAKRPRIVLRLDGRILDELEPDHSELHLQYQVPGLERERRLAIEISHSVNPAAEGIGGDGRDLALRLDSVAWREVRPAH